MTAPSVVRHLPYATLLAFTRYVDRTGPGKASFVGDLRRRRESGGGFNPHGQLIRALKDDIAFGTSGSHLIDIVASVNPRWQPLYSVLSQGAQQYLAALGEPAGRRLSPTREALVMLGGLPVKLAAHFGLRFDDGHGEAVRLHFDTEPPSPQMITATLHLMHSHMEQIMPGAEPVLVDVRRGQAHRISELTEDPGDVERWLTGEAAGFTAMWGEPQVS